MILFVDFLTIPTSYLNVFSLVLWLLGSIVQTHLISSTPLLWHGRIYIILYPL